MRNTIEHGFEFTTAHKASRLQVEYGIDAGSLVMRVQDDGPGLSGQWIQGARDAGDDPFEKIFQPGFTTRKEANEISGRGIGLDAVRSAVAGVDGIVRAFPVEPRGFGLSFSIPLDLIALEVVEVRAGGCSVWFPSDQIDVVPKPHPEEDLSGSDDAYITFGVSSPRSHVYARISSAAHQFNRVFAVDSVSKPRVRVFRTLDPSWRSLGSRFLQLWMERVDGRVLGGRGEEASREMTPLADPISWMSLVQTPR